MEQSCFTAAAGGARASALGCSTKGSSSIHLGLGVHARVAREYGDPGRHTIHTLKREQCFER